MDILLDIPQFLEELRKISPSVLLILEAVVFVLLAVGSGIGGLRVPPKRQRSAGVVGGVLWASGIALFVVQRLLAPNTSTPPEPPVPSVLLFLAALFLLLAVGSRVGRLRVSPRRQRLAGVFGGVFLASGIVLSVAPSVASGPAPTPTPTLVTDLTASAPASTPVPTAVTVSPEPTSIPALSGTLTPVPPTEPVSPPPTSAPALPDTPTPTTISPSSTPTPQILLLEPKDDTCVGIEQPVVFQWLYRPLNVIEGEAGEYYAFNLWTSSTVKLSVGWIKESQYTISLDGPVTVYNNLVDCKEGRGCFWNVDVIISDVPPGLGDIPESFRIIASSPTRQVCINSAENPPVPTNTPTPTPSPTP